MYPRVKDGRGRDKEGEDRAKVSLDPWERLCMFGCLTRKADFANSRCRPTEMSRREKPT